MTRPLPTITVCTDCHSCLDGKEALRGRILADMMLKVGGDTVTVLFAKDVLALAIAAFTTGFALDKLRREIAAKEAPPLPVEIEAEWLGDES